MRTLLHLPIWLLAVISFNCFGQKDFIRISYYDLIERGVLAENQPEDSSQTKTSGPLMMNYNPVINLATDSSNYEILDSLGLLQKATILTVYQCENVQEEAEIWGLDGEESAIKLTTQKASNSERVITYNGGKSSVPVLHTYSQVYKPEEETIAPASQKIMLGKYSSTDLKGMQGSLAELWIYNKKLGGKKRRQAQSILALKYGITLTDQDYSSSTGNALWKLENNSEHKYHIAGIGRDESLGLYQKQSASTAPGNVLAIGLNELAASNELNASLISDQNFIVWSDNNGLLTLESEQKAAAANRPRLIQRSWKIQRSGDETSQFSTTLHFELSKLFNERYDLGQYLLIIDHTGSGNFSPNDVTYTRAAGISEEGTLFFEPIQWDLDGSGSDVFTLTVETELTAGLSEETSLSCENSDGASVAFEASGGIPPYSYEFVKDGLSANSWSSTDEDINGKDIEDLGRGFYELVVTDLFGNQTTTSLEIDGPSPVAIDLGENLNLFYEGAMEVKPEIIADPDDKLTYSWESNNGFESDSETIKVNEPGIYTLTVTSEWGCTATDSLEVLDQFIEDLAIYPTFSEDGSYQVNVNLAGAEDIKVEVMSMKGDLLSRIELRDQASYNFQGKIDPIPGLYLIVLSIGGEQITRKFMVE